MLTTGQQRDVINLAEAFLKVVEWATPQPIAPDAPTSAPTTPSDWLTVTGFATRFGVSRTVVYESVRAGELKAHSTRIGAKIFVRANALDLLASKDQRSPGSN